MKLSDKELLDFSDKWASLPIHSRMVIRFLSECEKDKDGNYSWQGSFTPLSKKISEEKIDRSNFRKEILYLVNRNLIKKQDINKRNIIFTLYVDWKDRLLNL